MFKHDEFQNGPPLEASVGVRQPAGTAPLGPLNRFCPVGAVVRATTPKRVIVSAGDLPPLAVWASTYPFVAASQFAVGAVRPEIFPSTVSRAPETSVVVPTATLPFSAIIAPAGTGGFEVGLVQPKITSETAKPRRIRATRFVQKRGFERVENFLIGNIHSITQRLIRENRPGDILEKIRNVANRKSNHKQNKDNEANGVGQRFPVRGNPYAPDFFDDHKKQSAAVQGRDR